jgi:Family of unknown function (DUF6464)
VLFIGDSRCKYNALSADLRCTVNPCGPCDRCQDFEQVRERISLIGKPIAPMTRREILAHRVKMKFFELWAVVRYPMGMLQVICALTVLSLLISNKYPVSKEHLLGLLKSNTQIVCFVFYLLRMYDVVTEFNIHGRHRTNPNKFLRMLEPLAWSLAFDVTALLIMKSPVH